MGVPEWPRLLDNGLARVGSAKNYCVDEPEEISRTIIVAAHKAHHWNDVRAEAQGDRDGNNRRIPQHVDNTPMHQMPLTSWEFSAEERRYSDGARQEIENTCYCE